MSCDKETYDALFGTSKPGRVVATQYNVYCENAGCNNFTHILAADLKEAKKKARAGSWRMFKHGLCCPTCTAKLRRSKQTT